MFYDFYFLPWDSQPSNHLGNTPPKIHIEPENGELEDDVIWCSFSIVWFLGSILIFRGGFRSKGGTVGRYS